MAAAALSLNLLLKPEWKLAEELESNEVFMKLFAKLGIELFRPVILAVVDFALVIDALDGNIDELLLIEGPVPEPDVEAFTSPGFPP